jgi:elongation factor G
MMPFAPEKIRNVAFVGHRGSGKTSLAEALLFQAGAVTRLGSVADGSTVSDHDDDEKRRTMSISGSLLHAEYEGYKLNIFDAPGDPSFIADALAALRVVEGALFTVSAVAGVEVMTSRLWRRCDELESARVVFINHLDRDRADFAATLAAIQSQLSARCVAIAIPIGAEKDFRGVVDVLHMVAYEDAGDGSREAEPGPIPADLVAEAETWRTRLIEAVVEVSDDLTAKYLEGEEISGDELREALHAEVLRGELFPVACGCATKNEGTHALLDLIVEGVPAPSENFIKARAGDEDVVLSASETATAVYAFKTVADAHVGRISFVRVFSGTLHADVQLVNGRTGAKERIGQVLEVQGKEHHPVSELGPGDIGAVPKLKDVVAGDVLAERAMIVQGAPLPQPIVSVAVEPKVRGEDEKMATALRRLSEEDPTLRINRDERTSELLVSGLSQMHVEVTVERVKRRFGVEIVTHPPRVPYFEAIRGRARAHARYKKQTGGRGQFGDCHIELEPLPAHEGYEFVDKIVGGVIPQGFRPAVDKGIQDTMHTGDLAGYPVIGVRVTLVDGSYHSVDSSEMAFRIAGSMAFKKAYSEADPVLLEPIMSVEITSPSETVGDVIGDLNSRRGRPLGMDPIGASTVIRAEVPMSEMLSYAPDLTSLTGGRGDYAMSLARYDEVPAHVSQRLIADLQREREAAKA